MNNNSPLDRIDHKGRVALSFSLGKDSLAAWLYLRERGIEVVPYYMQAVPELGFIQKSINYYQDFFETEIKVIAHPVLFKRMLGGLHQPKYRMEAIRNIGLPIYDVDDVMDAITDDFFDGDCWHVVGVRANDSMNRRAAYKKTGGIVARRKVCWAIAESTNDWITGILQEHKCKLPIDYKLFGRSFDGLNYNYIKPIKEHLPGDWEVLKFYYPNIENEIKRFEMDHTLKGNAIKMKTTEEEIDDMDLDMDFDVDAPRAVESLPEPVNCVDGSRQEMQLLKSELQKIDAKVRKDTKMRTDGDYALHVVFQTTEQKERFLQALNLQAEEGQYLSGIKLAQCAGLDFGAVAAPKMKKTIKDDGREVIEL